jgi:hypothetical protein
LKTSKNKKETWQISIRTFEGGKVISVVSFPLVLERGQLVERSPKFKKGSETQRFKL